jgi:hypothetical protein
MPTLPELQAAFRRGLLDGDDAPIAAEIAGGRLAPAARLQVYRNHVLSTLTAALEATFPVVCRLVDRRFFGYAADRFIRAHPPHGPCLFEYGAALPDFLATFPPCRSLPYLPDVARLEWALNAAAHAEEGTPLDPAALLAVAPEAVGRVTLRLDPSLSLVASEWPVDRIWEAHRPDAGDAGPVDLDSGAARLEIRRHGESVGFRRLDPAPFALRRALLGGQPLEEAGAAALAADPGADLVALFHDLVREALVTGFAADC